jgi:hypothetical protein
VKKESARKARTEIPSKFQDVIIIRREAMLGLILTLYKRKLT